MIKNLFYIVKNFSKLQERISNNEKDISKLEQELNYQIKLNRNYIFRLKNNHPISNEMIKLGYSYSEISADQFSEILKKGNKNYLILEVGKHSCFQEKSIFIPLEEITEKSVRDLNHFTTIYVLSENGVSSVKACNKLVRLGFFNIIHISGGYESFPKDEKF